MGRVGGVSVLTIHQEAFLRSWTWTCIWAQIYYRNLPSRPSQPHKYRQISWISWKWYVGAGHTVRAVIAVFGHRAPPPPALKHTQLLGATWPTSTATYYLPADAVKLARSEPNNFCLYVLPTHLLVLPLLIPATTVVGCKILHMSKKY